MSRKTHGGIAEIIASGQCPGMHIRDPLKGRRGSRVVRDSTPMYNPNHRQLTCDQQDRREHKNFNEAKMNARRVARDRRCTKRADGEIRHVGQIPMSAFFGIEKEQGSDATQGGDLQETMKRKGFSFED